MREPSGRAERRHHVHRIVENLVRFHLATHYTVEDHSDCWCQKRPQVVLSMHPRSCPCRKRRKGTPRLANGMCEIGSRDRVYHWRKQNRELNQIVKTGADLEGNKVALLASSRSKHWSW